ncbi:MAG: type VI secretion lipoprotein TssJ, partial [Myxococcales bacterium]|nr:type VI secretion lipoprotein TssJ [Myxococcales bacterium]
TCPISHVDLVVDAGAAPNRGADGSGWPAHLEILQLGAAPRLSGDAEAPPPGELDALGEAPALAHDDRVFYPESHQRWRVALAPEATHLAIVGRFNHPTPGTWQATVATPVPAAAAGGRCPADDAPPPCVFVLVDHEEVRAGAAPPPGFVGDGERCGSRIDGRGATTAGGGRPGGHARDRQPPPLERGAPPDPPPPPAAGSLPRGPG